MRGFRVLLAFSFAAIMLLHPCATHAQTGFNIDLDDPFGNAQSGAGVPSSSFGAAANQPGFWNAVPDAGNPPMQLMNLAGQLTSVTITGPAGGSGGGWNFSGNTGDYALLLNDGNDVGGPGFNTWTFTNVVNGSYQIYTYAVFPNATLTEPAAVTVTGANQTTQNVSGPMPGNRFILGVTHCVNDVTVTNGSFAITINSIGNSTPIANGFQIVAVPEPSLLLLLSAGMFCIVVARPSVGRLGE